MEIHFCIRYVHFFWYSVYCADSFCVDIVATGRECPGRFFTRRRIFPKIPWSMNEVSNSIWTARLRALPSQAHMRRSARRAETGTILPTDTTLQFAVHNSGDLIVFVDFSHAGSRESLITEFGPASSSTRRTTVCIALDEIPTIYRQIFGRDRSRYERMT